MSTDSTRKKIEVAEQRKLRAEKEKHGFEPGARFDGPQQYVVSVRWYPKTKWIATSCSHDGKGWTYGEPIPLTKELWARLRPLRL